MSTNANLLKLSKLKKWQEMLDQLENASKKNDKAEIEEIFSRILYQIDVNILDVNVWFDQMEVKRFSNNFKKGIVNNVHPLRKLCEYKIDKDLIKKLIGKGMLLRLPEDLENPINVWKNADKNDADIQICIIEFLHGDKSQNAQNLRNYIDSIINLQESNAKKLKLEKPKKVTVKDDTDRIYEIIDPDERMEFMIATWEKLLKKLTNRNAQQSQMKTRSKFKFNQPDLSHYEIVHYPEKISTEIIKLLETDILEPNISLKKFGNKTPLNFLKDFIDSCSDNQDIYTMSIRRVILKLESLKLQNDVKSYRPSSQKLNSSENQNLSHESTIESKIDAELTSKDSRSRTSAKPKELDLSLLPKSTEQITRPNSPDSPFIATPTPNYTRTRRKTPKK